MKGRLPTILLILAMLACGPAASQQRPTQPRPAAPAAPAQPAPAPAAPEPPPAAYEPLLIKLAEVLGALAFLTDLCRDAGGTPAPGEAWRQRMRDLIESEATAAGQKERFAGAFNRGYAGYATTYRACTPAGRAAIERLLQDGARQARELSERYGL